ncbi:PaaX family transcriptional regulator C-terminal domain-containing protein [Streptomyces sp. SBR177]
MSTTDLRIGDITDPHTLAAALWPLDEIAERHRHLAAFAGACLTRLTDSTPPAGAERLGMAVELASHFTAAMKPDPLLPPELLPSHGPGPMPAA